MTPGRVARMRRANFGTAAVSALVLLTTLLTMRPVAAADPFATYAMTYRGIAAGPVGGVGASGGLVVFDGGPGFVVGRLDAAPSGSAEAASVEPGTMVRLVGGQVNDGAGDEVVGEPTTARAEFPGDRTEDDASQVAPQQAGPLTITGGHATVSVSPDASLARSGVVRFEIADQAGGAAAAALRARLAAWRTTWIDGDGGLTAAQQPRAADDAPAVLIAGAYGDGAATVDRAAGLADSVVDVGADRIEILGALVIDGVVGRAVASAAGDERSSTATLTIGEASLAGVPVTIDSSGIVVAEQQLVAGADVTAANADLNALLEQAGLRVNLLDTVAEQDDLTARASSGGLSIAIVTPSTSGIPRNELTMIVGRGEATVVAEPARPALNDPAPVVSPPPADAGAVAGATPPPSTQGSTPLGEPVLGGGQVPPVARPAPDVATPEVAPPTAPPTQVVAAGMTMSTRTAYAGFAAWMLFTFTLPLLGALLLGRKP